MNKRISQLNPATAVLETHIFEVEAVDPVSQKLTLAQALAYIVAHVQQHITSQSALNEVGVNLAVLLTLEFALPAAAPSLGLSLAAALSFERLLSAAPSLGVLMTATVTRERDLSASMMLGVLMEAVLSISADDHLLTDGFDNWLMADATNYVNAIPPDKHIVDDSGFGVSMVVTVTADGAITDAMLIDATNYLMVDGAFNYLQVGTP